MTVKFVVSSAAIEALLQSASISEAMVSEAESLRAAAAAAAPKRDRVLSDAYKVEAVTATVKTRRNGSSRRAAGRVSNDAPHAAPVEFGHFTTDGRRVAGRHTLGKLAGSKRARRRGK
ncbi:hypothetical protein [uncultured Actinomyces sp.]|uniref:hypothetical protein n=1 Tax=uncultured Actinomyces sp. TaxID=249061 RepID=UPI0028E757D5|nr:hypothetical protein [uncultured Actinomyces sp.]